MIDNDSPRFTDEELQARYAIMQEHWEKMKAAELQVSQMNEQLRRHKSNYESVRTSIFEEERRRGTKEKGAGNG